MKQNTDDARLPATPNQQWSGTIVITPAHRVTAFNNRFQALWRMPQSVLESRTEQPILEFISKQVTTLEAFLRQVRAAYAHPEKSTFESLRLVDGRVIESFSEPCRAGDATSGRIWTFHDLTSQLEGDSEPGRAESMARLAIGIAHDFGSLLSIIQDQTKWLIGNPRLSGHEREAASRIAQAAQRASEVTTQLRTFGQHSPAPDAGRNMNNFVLGVMSKLKTGLPDGIKLAFEPESELPEMPYDLWMLEQALVHLISNASDAMRRAGGSVRIRTRLVEIGASQVLDFPEGRPGQFVALSVSDTGCGMDEFTLSRIFKPFFTTKKAEKRAGLGLSKTYGIVKLHEGWIQVQSQPGKGSQFTVFLPTTAQPEPPEGPAASSLVAHENLTTN